jgi:hypothetical protein
LALAYKLRRSEYIRVKEHEGRVFFKLWPSNETMLLSMPILSYFPEFDLWDEQIEWHRCPDDLPVGIAYVEYSMVKGAASDENVPGIHVEANYVGRIDMISCSRFRLKHRVPFSMILPSAGIGRMRSSPKGKRLRRANQAISACCNKLRRL